MPYPERLLLEETMWKELAIVLGIGLLAGGYFLYFAPGVTEKNVRRIQYEMTRSDVEALFGCPPVSVSRQSTDGSALPEGYSLCTWQDADRKAYVCFSNRTVVWVTFESRSGTFGRSFTYSLYKPQPVLNPR